VTWVRRVFVNFNDRTAEVICDPDDFRERDLLDALVAAGYRGTVL